MSKLLLALMLGLSGLSTTRAAEADPAAAALASFRNTLAGQVRAAENAFAATMAARDATAFAGYVSEEALFFGEGPALRGRAAIVQGWSGYFKGPDAPFSWEPQTVEVLDSGTLALSSGPVRNSKGEVIATFNSIWRLEIDGHWRVIFDKGCPGCPPPAKP